MLIVPPEKLASEILDNIMESFITRDGTDYGETELDMGDKLNILRPQILKGEVLIIYDNESDSLTLIPRREYANRLKNTDNSGG